VNTGSSNGWKLWLILGTAVVFAVAGARHVWMEREPLLLKQRVFEQLSRNRALEKKKDTLEKQIFRLRASPRVNRWASDLLGMRVPNPDEVIRMAAQGRSRGREPGHGQGERR